MLYLYYFLSREKIDFFKESVKQLGEKEGEYLWIHFEEKWFWGVLLRKTANKFDGINTGAVRIYHKSHISKTTGIAVVRMAFEDTLENGGGEIKLVLQR